MRVHTCIRNFHVLIWIRRSAIVLHFCMHLPSTRDCTRGRHMNRDVRLSYTVIFYTLTSNIANFDFHALLVYGASLLELMNTPGISCHAVRFSIYEAFNPIFPVRRWRTWSRGEGEDCYHTLGPAYYEHHILFDKEWEIGLFHRRLNTRLIFQLAMDMRLLKRKL